MRSASGDVATLAYTDRMSDGATEGSVSRWGLSAAGGGRLLVAARISFSVEARSVATAASPPSERSTAHVVPRTTIATLTTAASFMNGRTWLL